MSTNYGLNEKLRYYEIALDSLDNSGAQGTQYAATDWPSFLLGGKAPFKNIAAVKILEVQIPFTYYVFVERNRTFTLKEDGQPDATVTLEIGNYTASELCTIMADALTAASPSGKTYSVTYSSNTQKFTFKNGAGSTEPFTFNFGAPTNSGNINPRLYIGFPGGDTTSQTFGAGGDTMVAPNAAQVSGPNYLYLNSLKLGQLCNMYLPKGAFNLGGGNAGPQMAKIPVNVQQGGVIYWQDPGILVIT